MQRDLQIILTTALVSMLIIAVSFSLSVVNAPDIQTDELGIAFIFIEFSLAGYLMYLIWHKL